MASTIAAVTTGGGGVITTADSSGNLSLLSGATTVVAVTATGVAVTGTLAATGAVTLTDSLNTPNTFGFKNRIINGGMVIDQRNAGASSTAGGYTVDRFNYVPSQASKGTWQQNAGAVTPPAGFANYLGFTSSSAYSVLAGDYFDFTQIIEGYNFADLAWGTASASTVTLSFWVRSSLTGTFGGALYNSSPRSYPFSYTISSANTWEQKTITIAGDTSGTYSKTNTAAVQVLFGLGNGSTVSGTAGSWSSNTYFSATGATSVVGTSGATFYITGVQLEKGSTATSFDFRAYSTELAMCQRYLPAFISTSTNDTLPCLVFGATATAATGTYTFMTRARVRPTGITVSAGSHFTLTRPSTGNVVATAVSYAAAGTDAAQLEFNAASGLVADQSYLVRSNSASAYILFTGCEL
jgi:hypothetical protein